ncbi:MAG TPA: DUF1932 domain-containing protein [Burkholderiales bacterium]
MRVAFVGFGEVASVFAAALQARGCEVAAYDRLLESADGRERLAQRVRGAPVRLSALADALADAEYVFSSVTTDVALEAARACVPHLGRGQVFVDLNACAPQRKREIAALIGPSGAAFVEGALLGAIAVEGSRTELLLGGEHAERAARELSARGLNARFFGAEIGRASTFKMLRSVLSKGLEALLIEFLVAGERSGLRRELWAEAERLFASHSFGELAGNWVASHATAHERRWHEMAQVADVLRALGVEPVMTAATEALFRRSVELRLKDDFPARPRSPETVVQTLERKLR